MTNTIEHKHWLCAICHKDAGPIYMIKDDLWRMCAGAFSKDLICWDCFEGILGRAIEIEDLKPDPPCNQFFIKRMQKHKEANIELRDHLADLNAELVALYNFLRKSDDDYGDWDRASQMCEDALDTLTAIKQEVRES